MSGDKVEAAGGYLVLARKYRPRNFDQLIGQDAMVRTLTNAFKTGRIAQGYMLTGVRGVGKTTTARIIARALNYSVPGKADGPSVDMPEFGEHCAAIMESRHVDVIEMDAASHTGIGDIREIIEAVRYKPVSARYKVYIIDEVHMLSAAAFNGLLKTLEEPPAHVKFIFATTEIRKVPITVLSRCQRFDMRRVEAELLVAHLRDIAAKEGVNADGEALAMIARAAEGSVRDALSLMDQAISHAAGTIEAASVRDMLGLADRGRVIELFRAVMAGEVKAALGELRAQYDEGADPVIVLSDLAQFTHLVTRIKFVPEAARDMSLVEEERVRGKAFADKLSPRALSRAWQMLLKGVGEAQAAGNPLAAAEMVIVRLAHAADLPAPDEVIRQLRSQSDSASPTRAGTPATPTGAPIAQANQVDDPRGEDQGEDVQPEAPPDDDAQSERADGADTQAIAFDQPPAAAVARLGRHIQSLEDIVALAAEAREAHLKFALEHSVRLVRFEPGRIEFSVEPGADANLAHSLSAKLQEWTGARWMIVVSARQGGETIAERHAAARARLLREAKADPAVRRVLEQFPGAEIVDVRENRLAADSHENDQADPPAQQAADGE